MNSINKKSVLYVTVLIIVGVVFNRMIADTASFVGLPLYLDCIGTIFAAVLGGAFPGMLVGFLTNMLGGISDTSTFYYGTINVLIALIAHRAAERGCFEKFHKIFITIPYLLLLSLPCSLLTYILFSFSIGDNVSSDVVLYLHGKGLPVIVAQIIGDYTVEIPDKLISVIVAYLLYKITPMKIKATFDIISGRALRRHYTKEEKEKRSSLRNQIAFGLLVAGLLIALVAFFISYKTYMESKVAGYPDGNYDVHLLRTETLLYSSKMLSAVLGLLLCIVAFAMVLADNVIVSPLYRMAKEMRRFAYDSDSGRDKSVHKIESLDIHTQNEIEELYNAISKTVKNIDEYIDMTNKQAELINDMHVNIITALADIVESRDSVTGFHVKRTAEYCRMLAEELRREGLYTDELTDEYIDTLTIAAPLHDIGKIKIPDAILNKPGRLTDEEYDVIKTHTVYGIEMLKNAGNTMGETEYLHMAEDIAYYHHEWWDGNKRGYPEDISGEKIPLSARIMAVADVFDALMSKRPYKESFPIEKTINIMQEEKGTHFDPDIINAMMKILDSMVEVAEKYSD